MSGRKPLEIDVAALLVETMSSEPSAPLTSQVQPEPKFETVALANVCLNAVSVFHRPLIASARTPPGSPPPCGERLLQNNLWFQTCAALLKAPLMMS